MSPLRVVAPVHDEAAVLVELATRCLAAARAVEPDAVVLLVDDASTDATQALVPSLPDGVSVLRLPHNRGQWGATQAGLATARDDEVVVVIDGDLQDPPEHLGALVAALRADPALDVVFATKVAREDPVWFRAARAVYAAGLALAGGVELPRGAGAYCALRGALARRAATLPLRDANLAPVLAALGAHAGAVAYVKEARYDGRSRVGPLRLVREGLASWLLVGVVERVLAVTGAVLLARAALRPGLGVALLGAALLAGAARARHVRCRLLSHAAPEDAEWPVR